jgi:1-acyl-sn-glycerol-3-phosphate acyltransferase
MTQAPRTLLQKFGHYCLTFLGWRLEFNGLPATHGVIVVYPHTSNWDFLFGILAKWASGIGGNFWVKNSFFTGFAGATIGPFLKSWGALPVERSAASNLVQNTVTRMRAEKTAWLVLAPEGTRSLATGWRSGFYRVACELKSPLGLSYIDFSKKQIKISEFISLSGDEATDLQRIRDYYESEGVVGFNHELTSPIQFGKN